MVDAVIFSLRDNGFLVYIPVYAIKGPVYLENREKEVLITAPQIISRPGRSQRLLFKH